MDCSLPDSSVHGISQARILEWVACPPLGDLPYPGIESASLGSPALQVDSLPLRLGSTCHWLIRSISSTPQGALVVRNLPASKGDQRDEGFILGSGRSLEMEMASHSSNLAWEIP